MKEFKISSRLLKCAEMVTSNAKVADIGTDHAYIPIYLALKNKITYALACDIKEGPLKNARNNIEKYNLNHIIKPRISDGLKNISKNEVDEIIIAGMGGNTIIKILQECTWDNKKSKKFILQPMKYESNLRVYLAEYGYKVLKENAVTSFGKVYVAMSAVFTGVPYTLNAEEIYIGEIDRNPNDDAKAYIKKQLKSLKNRQIGARAQGLRDQEKCYSETIKKLENLLYK